MSGILAPLIMAGGSILGGLFGGKPKQSTVQNSAPWSAQQPYLTDLFGRAQGTMQNRLAAGPYTGNFYSPINAYQNGFITNATNYAGGPGQTLANQSGAAAGTLMGAANPFMTNGEGIAANGISGSAPGLSSALNGAAQAGAAGIQNIIQNASTDAVPQLTQDAAGVMNSAPVQQQMNAANAQINQTLNEQTVPGLDRQAAMGGALNSSRAGMADALARQGAAIATGTTDAGIMGNAFNSGLNAATQARDTGLMAGQWAANGAMNTGLSGALDNTNAMLQGNNQVGTAASMGFNGAGTSANLANGVYNLGYGAGTALQNNQNMLDQNAYTQWNMGNTYDQNVLQGYQGLISGNYGNTGSSTTTMPYSPLANAMGTGMMLGAPSGPGGSFGDGSSIAGQVGNWASNAWNGGAQAINNPSPYLGNTIMSAYG